MVSLVAAVLLVAAQSPAAKTPGSPSATAPGQPPPAARASKSFPVEYVPPKNPQYMEVYEKARAGRVLEGVSNYLDPIRMPRPLKLRLSDCDGESNAWYDNEEHSATFCYEFISDFMKNAPGGKERGLDLDEAVLGPFVFFYLHEIGHAIFDMLQLPVLGREEDAADRFAAFVLLHSGEYISTRTLRGTAWAFYHDARGRKPDEADFADVHGLDAQRYYDVLCLAYGSDPVLFKGAVEKAGLPRDRADTCADEWRVVNNAFRKVLAPYIDKKRFKQVRDETVARAKARRSLKPVEAKATEPPADAPKR